jgi:hypothetical protein
VRIFPRQRQNDHGTDARNDKLTGQRLSPQWIFGVTTRQNSFKCQRKHLRGLLQARDLQIPDLRFHAATAKKWCNDEGQGCVIAQA